MADFEATDRYMSGWVATCVHNGTRFFTTDGGWYTTILANAAWRRWGSEADAVAAASADRGFPMAAERVAEILGGAA